MADGKTLTFPPLTLEELAAIHEELQKEERALVGILRARKEHPELQGMVRDKIESLRKAGLEFSEKANCYTEGILEVKYARAPETITSNPVDFLVRAYGVSTVLEHPEYLERFRAFLSLFSDDVVGKSLTISYGESIDGQVSSYPYPKVYEVARLERVPVVKLNAEHRYTVYVDIGKHTHIWDSCGPHDSLIDQVEIDLNSIVGKKPVTEQKRYHIRIKVEGKEIYRNPLDAKEGTRFAELDEQEDSASPSGSDAHATNIVPGNP